MKKRKKKLYVVVCEPPQDCSYIAFSSENARLAHQEARKLTKEEGCPHVVLKPVAEYTNQIKKKRFN